MTGDGRGVRFLDESGVVALTYMGLSVLDADGRELEASFEATCNGGESLLPSVDERGARYPLVVDPIAQQAYLEVSNTETYDRFGTAVAASASGDTVVVGSRSGPSHSSGDLLGA